jgi:hypothetical protein
MLVSLVHVLVRNAAGTRSSELAPLRPSAVHRRAPLPPPRELTVEFAVSSPSSPCFSRGIWSTPAPYPPCAAARRRRPAAASWAHAHVQDRPITIRQLGSALSRVRAGQTRAASPASHRDRRILIRRIRSATAG